MSLVLDWSNFFCGNPIDFSGICEVLIVFSVVFLWCSNTRVITFHVAPLLSSVIRHVVVSRFRSSLWISVMSFDGSISSHEVSLSHFVSGFSVVLLSVLRDVSHELIVLWVNGA